jgi:hypothetical protein
MTSQGLSQGQQRQARPGTSVILKPTITAAGAAGIVIIGPHRPMQQQQAPLGSNLGQLSFAILRTESIPSLRSVPFRTS